MKSNIYLGVVIAFFISLAVAPFIIKLMQKLKAGQPILNYVEMHNSKQGTPTMGGVIFILGTVMSIFAVIKDNYGLSIIVLVGMLSFAVLGFLDDYIKVRLKINEGLKPYQKVVGQVGIATLISVFAYNSSLVGNSVIVPFSHSEIVLGVFAIFATIFIFIAVTNSVNLIDGLDGLASGVSIAYLIGFGLLLSIRINQLENFGENLQLITEMKNILIITGGLIGGLLAFLIFNSHKAKIFMGDTGSLAIGGFIATSAILTKMYLYIPFLGVMYVLTVISDILQVLYYKKTKKRIFLMAPLHHHFEKKGCNETKIVAIYIIITMMMSALCLMVVSFI